VFDVAKRDMKFLEAIGYGKQESEWITQYDTFPVRGGFLCPYMIVGREPKYMRSCGMHRCRLSCKNSSLHGAVSGRDVWFNQVYNCHSYRCCVCWKYGWCVRRGHMVEDRFLTAEKVLGLPVSSVEHLFASAPKYVYDYSPQKMNEACISACRRRGILGGVNILHPFRKDLKARELVLSFHYHLLGYVDEGYDRCRECEKNIDGFCVDLNCDGFQARTQRVYHNDGWIVGLAKNEAGIVEKRESIFSTAWYQLEHSGFKVGVRRFQIVEWWGNVAKRKFKAEKRRLVCNCPVCKSKMKLDLVPAGVQVVSNRGERGFLKYFTLPHVDDND
jgi:hypothetical protein